MKSPFTILFFSAMMVFFVGCGEDDEANPTSGNDGTSYDEDLTGTWVGGTLAEDGTFTPESGMFADTLRIDEQSFTDGFVELPQTDGCKLDANGGKIGVKCSSGSEYIYDYLVEGDILYLEEHLMGGETSPDGEVDKSTAETYKKIE